ncbi:hypothetical protein BDZ89DRAFT_1066767 [Hymenopellis radicata]|nr:hypothetical protein BDZ89DRAFT_1066767 [Hymenopellis radicata]
MDQEGTDSTLAWVEETKEHSGWGACTRRAMSFARRARGYVSSTWAVLSHHRQHSHPTLEQGVANLGLTIQRWSLVPRHCRMQQRS